MIKLTYDGKKFEETKLDKSILIPSYVYSHISSNENVSTEIGVLIIPKLKSVSMICEDEYVEDIKEDIINEFNSYREKLKEVVLSNM